MKIFDSHIHIQPWDMVHPHALALLADKQVDRDEIRKLMSDPDALVALLDRERISRVCMINYIAPQVMGFTENVNRFASEYARRYPQRIVAYGSVHPLMTRDAAGDVKRLVDLGLRGIKIHPSHQLYYPNQYRSGLKTLETIYDAASRHKLPVMIHTGTSIFPGARNVYADPIYCDDVGIDFPDLRVILAHGGRPLWMDTAVFLLRRFPNFLMDVSSIPPQNLLKYFPRLEDMANQTLFGSDWPAPGVPGMRSNADRFLQLSISDDAKRKILYENAARLYVP